MRAIWETLNMVDLINVLLRAVMCIAFIMWVVRPMLMTFSRRELDQSEIEETAQMAINSAFQAYSNNTTTNYYDNPQLAVFMAQNPDLHIPTDEEMAQRQKAALEQAQADEAAAQLAAANPVAELVATDGPAAGVNASAEVATDPATGVQQAPADGFSVDATAVTVVDVPPGDEEAETLEQMRERVKLENKQKKPTIPPELLQNANSYEDQLMVVRMIVDQEQSRVASVIRNMIQVK
jgi:flagellar biosynthesis/type III secretory pathway M-ring protein FliF/YscJ